MPTQVIFTRSSSAASVVEALIRRARRAIDAALYRFSNPKLARALRDAAARGVAIRLVLNSNDHYEENRAAQETLGNYGIAFRLSHGRRGLGSKMHHKFAVVDRRSVVTGSYNWTLESEKSNYENLLVLGSPRVAAEYAREFERLWAEAGASAASVKKRASNRQGEEGRRYVSQPIGRRRHPDRSRALPHASRRSVGPGERERSR